MCATVASAYPQYFNIPFEQKTGKTPLEFRNLNLPQSKKNNQSQIQTTDFRRDTDILQTVFPTTAHKP